MDILGAIRLEMRISSQGGSDLFVGILVFYGKLLVLEFVWYE